MRRGRHAARRVCDERHVAPVMSEWSGGGRREVWGGARVCALLGLGDLSFQAAVFLDQGLVLLNVAFILSFERVVFAFDEKVLVLEHGVGVVKLYL